MSIGCGHPDELIDEDSGDDHSLRQDVEDLDLWYCFEVSKNREVWSEDPPGAAQKSQTAEA